MNYPDKNSVSLENKLKQLNDISEHKILVFKYCSKLSNFLFEKNQDELALKLMTRGFSHDISKLNNDEFYGMAMFADDTKSLKDPKEKVSDEKEIYVNLHRDRNRHHPEYWDDADDMKLIDILELCCDWCARSEQFGTDVIEFLETRQDTQFNFSPEIYGEIKKYLILLTNL